MFTVVSIVFILAGSAMGRDICYDDLGCFTDTNPYGGTLQRPFAFLPESPQKISVRYTLFSGGNSLFINSTFEFNILKEFNASRKTKFIIPGLKHGDDKEWVRKMRLSILKHDSVNLIVVDWSNGNGY